MRKLQQTSYSLDEHKSNLEKNIYRFIEATFTGAFAAVITTTMIWFVSGRTGLISPIISIFGGLSEAMYLGSLIFGLVSGVIISVIASTKEARKEVVIIGGAFGGALAGLLFSLITFPLLVIVGSS